MDGGTRLISRDGRLDEGNTLRGQRLRFAHGSLVDRYGEAVMQGADPRAERGGVEEETGKGAHETGQLGCPVEDSQRIGVPTAKEAVKKGVERVGRDERDDQDENAAQFIPLPD